MRARKYELQGLYQAIPGCMLNYQSHLRRIDKASRVGKARLKTLTHQKNEEQAA
jgi:hypothetical protein